MPTPLPVQAWNTELGRLENLGDFANAKEGVAFGRYVWMGPAEPFDVVSATREQKQRFLLHNGVGLTVDQGDDWIDAAVRRLQGPAPAEERTWTPPNIWKEVSPSLCCRIIDEIDAGIDDGEELYSKHNRAAERAAWKLVIKHKPDMTEAQAKKIIARWVKTGVLYEERYDSKKQRKQATGLRANPAKRPGGQTS